MISLISAPFKKTFLFVLVGAFSVGTLLQACSASGVSITLSIDSNAYRDGRLTIDASLQNSSSRSITFLPWNTPFDQGLYGNVFQVVDVDSGEVAPYIGRMVKRRAPQSDDYLTIKSGETLDSSIAGITAAYALCKERKYRVSFVSDLFSPDFTSVHYQVEAAEFVAFTDSGVCD